MDEDSSTIRNCGMALIRWCSSPLIPMPLLWANCPHPQARGCSPFPTTGGLSQGKCLVYKRKFHKNWWFRGTPVYGNPYMKSEDWFSKQIGCFINVYHSLFPGKLLFWAQTMCFATSCWRLCKNNRDMSIFCLVDPPHLSLQPALSSERWCPGEVSCFVRFYK